MQRRKTTRTILVTGASRGIGAETARQLARPDTHVVVNYRAQTQHANAVASAIRAAGGQASTVAADISDDAASAAMIEDIGRRFGTLDALVLNASGGLDQRSDANSARRANRAAQRNLVRLVVPLMPTGGRIVFVTTHAAHFYPHKAVPKGYATTAASKWAGESALHAMRSDLHRSGIDFTVVSGDIVGDHEPADGLGEFAATIANTVMTPAPSRIVYFRGADHVDRISA